MTDRELVRRRHFGGVDVQRPGLEKYPSLDLLTGTCEIAVSQAPEVSPRLTHRVNTASFGSRIKRRRLLSGNYQDLFPGSEIAVT